MGSSSGFPIDLILFGMIAAFLVLRLRSILGKRTGFERPPQPYRPPQTPGAESKADTAPTIEGRAEPVPAPASARALPDAGSPAGQALARIRNVDRTFDASRFLDGAEQAFRMIVEAFAAGNREVLRRLLSADTYRSFEAAIAAREAAGQTQRTEIRAIHGATIEAASLLDKIADITVRFASDQINVTLGRDDAPVGGTDAVTEITDLWTFERDLSSRDPTWHLVAARSA
ncbi:MAG: Tim44 domain-containing protein [Acetobacteraceae bacterium]|nr:Tim44 domain-containing protein [Acetobacteraceae bacterium]